MSYCRWSCLDGYSDAYVYQDVNGGWTTHLSGNRQAPGAPCASLELLLCCGGDENHPAHIAYKAGVEARRQFMETHGLTEIKLEGAGGSFNHDTPGECADHLEEMARRGFIIPSWAIAALRQEQAEMDTPPHE